ncbi:hypothetical protein [Maliponia aquimaris]|uniref:Uncharacterized protein n=1 Tax=Maliponia aquimaris TaxID=1673631 RepID=A0A238JYU6_9RHOB|nr:hypothetical protein [Maliponia aquimaris]SMX35825.1 hypothetical protein MAA8898_00657 [Maliponia aquimaris]
MTDLGGKPVNLLELSVPHCLLARALDGAILRQGGLSAVITPSDADMIAAFTALGAEAALVSSTMEEPGPVLATVLVAVPVIAARAAQMVGSERWLSVHPQDRLLPAPSILPNTAVRLLTGPDKPSGDTLFWLDMLADLQRLFLGVVVRRCCRGCRDRCGCRRDRSGCSRSPRTRDEADTGKHAATIPGDFDARVNAPPYQTLPKSLFLADPCGAGRENPTLPERPGRL